MVNEDNLTKFLRALHRCFAIFTMAYSLVGFTMPVCASQETKALELMQNSLKVTGPFTTELPCGGFSGSEVIKVNAPDKAYVVRFWNMMQWAEDFPQDLACQIVASDAGYGPKVHFADEVEGITVMEYLFPEILPEKQVRLQALVDLLKKIHTGPIVPKGLDRSIYLNSFIEETKETQIFALEAIKAIKDTVFAALCPNANCVPCHRDLHHGNLIYMQRTFFAIDYTWGAMDDPYVDLANIAICNCETFAEELLLLQLYLGREPTPAEVARLSLMKLPAKMFYGLEFLKAASVSTMSRPITVHAASKSYMDFGRHGGATPCPADFLNYASSLLGEVLDYSNSEQYVMDLVEISRYLSTKM